MRYVLFRRPRANFSQHEKGMDGGVALSPK